MTTNDTAVPLIRVTGLTKTYGHEDGRLTVLNAVALDVLPGEFFVLLGSSGSGKSTLLNLIKIGRAHV